MPAISDPFARALLISAGSALEDEDRALARAFATTERVNDENYERQGLGYPLYETTLCYIIWKRWLTITDDVVWDGHPPENNSKLVDLQVRANNGTRYYFEAKIWRSPGHGPLKDDADKLGDFAAPDVHRFLLAFWWNAGAEDPWPEDQALVKKTAGKVHANGFYLQRFSTHCHPEKRKLDKWRHHYFALAAYELS